MQKNSSVQIPFNPVIGMMVMQAELDLQRGWKSCGRFLWVGKPDIGLVIPRELQKSPHGTSYTVTADKQRRYFTWRWDFECRPGYRPMTYDEYRAMWRS